MSLERLSKLIIKDLTDYVDFAEDKSVTMKQEFFAFKQQANQLRHTCDDHFQRILGEILNDFPDLKSSKKAKKGADSSDDEGVPTPNKKI